MSFSLRLLLGFFIAFSLLAVPAAMALQDETAPAAESQEEPAAEEPASEEPSAEEPATEEPASEEPSAEEPSKEEPSKEEAPAEEDSKGSDKEEPATEEAPEVEASAEDFPAIFAEWKTLISELRALQDEYKIAKPADRAPLVEKFNALVAQGDSLAPRLRKAAEAAYVADSEADPEVGNFLASTVVGEMARGEFPEALRVAQLLIDNGFANPSIYNEAGMAAFYVGEGQTAVDYFQKAQEAGVLNANGEKHNKEQLVRNAEAEADDLPRVMFTTNKGDITLELFENEAPNTVANFVELIESGFYNGLTFHRVIDGFMAQGGCPTGDGTGGPGYNIACECYGEDHREHFAGTLSMAHAGRDTGGSQFFITFAPTPHLDGKHTVFGRVIDGMDVVNELQVRSPQGAGEPDADKIIEAKVLRKRDHEYKAAKIGGSPEANQ